MQNRSFRAALIYLVVGLLWTIITNWLINELLPGKHTLLWFTIRSLTFVILSTIGVYFVFKVHYRYYHSAERKYEQLFQNYPQPMWIYDIDTYRFLKVNKAAIDTYGYNASEFAKLRLLDLFPGSEAEMVQEKIESIKHKEFADGIITRHFRKDGSSFFVRLTSFRTTFEGRMARLVTVADISVQMEAEIKMATLLNSSDDLIWLLNRSGKLVTWSHSFNQKYQDITGNSFSESREPNLFDLPKNETVVRWQDYFLRAMQGEHIKVEETAGQKNTETYEVIIEPIAHADYGTLGVGFFARDITLRKQNETDILEKITRLKEISWVQSHELRRPLANILGLVDLIRITPSERTEDLQQIISQLEKSSEELDQVVRLIVEKSSLAGGA